MSTLGSTEMITAEDRTSADNRGEELMRQSQLETTVWRLERLDIWPTKCQDKESEILSNNEMMIAEDDS